MRRSRRPVVSCLWAVPARLVLPALLVGWLAGCGARDVGWFDVVGEGAGAGGVGGSGGSAGVGGTGGSTGGTGGAAGSGGLAGSGGVAGAAGAGAAAGTGGVGGVAGAGGVGGSGGHGGVAGSGGFAGAGGHGGVGGSGGAAGSGGAGAEICDNGVDDDGDGQVDCQDPECTDYLCAPPVPLGWTGPVAFWEGSGGEPPPLCDDAGGYPAYEIAGSWGLNAEPALCPSCDCSDPQGVACQVASVGFHEFPGCPGAPGTLTIPSGVCQGFVTTSIDPQSASWQSAPSAGGACLPDPLGSPVIPPVAWDEQALACGDPATGAGCGPGVCVPRPAPPFATELCVYRWGDLACPAGPYSDRRTYYGGAIDDRDCTDCGCGDPTGTSCEGTVRLYTDTACGVDERSLSSVGQCVDIPLDPTPPPPPYMSLRSVIYEGIPASTGSCAVVPSDPVGSVTPTAPLTFCCR